MRTNKNGLTTAKLTRPFLGSAAALGVLVSGLSLNIPVRAGDVTVENARQIGFAIASALGTGTPLQATLNCNLLIENLLCWAPYVVPENVYFEIDYLSTECSTNGSFQFSGISIYTQWAGVVASHAVNLPLSPSSVAGTAEFGQLVKFYADPGSTIRFYISAASGSFDSPCTITFTGRQIST